MRTFIALNLRPELRDQLHDATAPLRDLLGRGVAWVAAPSLHVTLKFLGDIPEALVERLRLVLAPEVRKLGPISLRVGGVGAFPSMGRPNVLWVGVDANPALARLYHLVEDACASLGAPRERRPFHPHVTIGRVRAGAAVDGQALARVAAEIGFAATEPVASVDVMESSLGAGGARYRVVAGLTLGERVQEG